MKISVVGPAYPLRGGIAHHVYWLRRELEARGHTVQVISFRRLYPGILFPGTTEIDSSRLGLDAGADPVLTALNPRTWARAFRLVAGFHPDLVVFQWWQPFFAPLVGTLVRRFRRNGLLSLIECHNVLPHEGSPLDLLLTRFAFSRADEFIAHSGADCQRLRQLKPDRRVSLSPLPTLKEFTGEHPHERRGRRILFFGKVRRYKGLDVLLAAMPTALARVDCELLIAGEFYEPVEKYQRIIRAGGVEDKVRIVNRYVSNEEVGSYFAGADVLVLPYLSASQSGVAQIALANGLPIIASRTGGLPETVTEGVNGLLFEPGNADELAEKIVAYFDDDLGPLFARNLAAPSQARAECRIVELIERAASSPPCGPFDPAIVGPTNQTNSIKTGEK